MTTTKSCPQCGASYAPDQRFCALDGSALRSLDPNAGLIGAVVADRYLVQRRLGEGGMGEVYLAEHVRMGRPSALKVMRPAMAADADAVSRFNREAANASRIAHPNVAAIYDFGETPDGLIYLAMEYVEGEPLRSLLERGGALPPARAARLAGQVADALDAAHALGIVHRDLKPDNVMIGRAHDGLDLVKVVDFGIAKASGAEGQQVTRTGLVVGTPEYMSPEQLAGDPVDHRSDVYALGLVAYTMLTGRHPYPSETIADTLVQRLTTPPLRLAELRPEVAWPAAVQGALDRALARRPADRFAQAGAFARALAGALDAAGLLAAGDVALSEAPTQVIAAQPAPVTPVAAAAPPTVVDGARAEILAPRPAAGGGVPRRRPAALAAIVGIVALAVAGGGWVATRGRGTDDAPGGVRNDVAAATDSAPAAPAGVPRTSARAATLTVGPATGEGAPAPAHPAPAGPGAGLAGTAPVQPASDDGEVRARVERLERMLTHDVPNAGDVRAALATLEPLRDSHRGDAPLDLRVRFLHAVFSFAASEDGDCSALLALPATPTLAALPPALAQTGTAFLTNCEHPGIGR